MTRSRAGGETMDLGHGQNSSFHSTNRFKDRAQGCGLSGNGAFDKPIFSFLAAPIQFL
jgi:hypothetical protein